MDQSFVGHHIFSPKTEASYMILANYLFFATEFTTGVVFFWGGK